MGRSQVLYNRTKGRNKNRPGRGGNRTNEESSSVNRRKDSGYINKPREQFQPSSSINRQTPKDYEHEYEVLFAGRTTYLSSSKTRGDDNDDNENFLLGGSTNGSICIPSMAATLESMEISKRLRIPMRVAAKAFPERFRMAQEEEREMESPRETTVGDSNIETNKTASNGSSSDLEDWLDDACGIVDEDKEETLQRNKYNPKDDTIGTMNAVAGNALAQAEEDCGDDNLDDWLDSVIE
eukprot:CAMPEP_0116153924 /NCGR_PEP_ID=MMETSP0329-20121206/21504_1 /TAXON_ID=697910 /ORGANISM="Pseudo-nitzschia arenysensis, Strain B593" /LENGTH=237 /DNA_ID=CAMNT_0003650865 /DNA_START=59 /DNA_END=773 /DNA_ORIENTATION=-